MLWRKSELTEWFKVFFQRNLSAQSSLHERKRASKKKSIRKLKVSWIVYSFLPKRPSLSPGERNLSSCREKLSEKSQQDWHDPELQNVTDFDGYIRVKIFQCRGKNLEEHAMFAKSILFVIQNHPFCYFCLFTVPKQRAFIGVKFGLKVLLRVK